MFLLAFLFQPLNVIPVSANPQNEPYFPDFGDIASLCPVNAFIAGPFSSLSREKRQFPPQNEVS